MIKMNYMVRSYRKALNMTQTELGDLIGYSNGYISAYEHCRIEAQNGVDYAMMRVLNRELDSRGDKGFYIAKAALIYCDICLEMDGFLPDEAFERAKRDCKLFAEGEFDEK